MVIRLYALLSSQYTTNNCVPPFTYRRQIIKKKEKKIVISYFFVLKLKENYIHLAIIILIKREMFLLRFNEWLRN